MKLLIIIILPCNYNHKYQTFFSVYNNMRGLNFLFSTILKKDIFAQKIQIKETVFFVDFVLDEVIKKFVAFEEHLEN